MHGLHNPIVQFTGNDELDFELIQIEISSTYIDLFSMILNLISAKGAIDLILQRAMKNQQNNSSEDQQQAPQEQSKDQSQQKQQQQSSTQHPTPSEIAAFSSCLNLYTILIYTRVSFIRLNEIYNKILAGTTTFSITPNIYGTIGFIYSVIGTLLRTIGAIQRVDEEGKIIIL